MKATDFFTGFCSKSTALEIHTFQFPFVFPKQDDDYI